MFRLLHLRRFAQHPLRTGLSAAGIAIGTALIVAVLGLFGSIATSVEWLAKTSGDADFEILPQADAGLRTPIVREIQAVPGVADVAPLVRLRVGIEGKSAILLGADQRAAVFGEAFSACEPRSVVSDPNGVVLGAPLAATLGVAPGDRIEVQRSAGWPVTVSVIGITDCPTVDRLNRGHIAVGLLPAAQRIAGRGDSVDAVLVSMERGTPRSEVESALAQRLGDRAVVWSPAARIAEARNSLRPVQDGSLMVAVMAIVVAGFLVYNAMSMAALERRRELATLRALGGRRRPLLVNFLAEAGLLGVLGSAAGVGIGVVVAQRLVEWIPPFFIDLFGVEPSFSLPPAAVPTALIIGVGASVAAAWLPGRAAVRVDPVDAMRPDGVLETGESERPVNPIVLGVGVLVLLGSTAVVLTGDETTAMIGTALVLLGGVAVTAGAMTPLARAAARAAAWTGRAGRLGGAALERAPRRAWATTLAVAMAVAVMVATGGLLENQRREFGERIAPLGRSDLFVQTASAESIPVDILMPNEWVEQIRDIPGVERVVPGQFGFVLWDGRRVIFEAMGGESNSPVFYDVPESARRDVLAGEALILGRGFARDRNVGVGDRLTIPTPAGAKELPVAGVVDISFGVSPGPVVLSLDRMREWYGRDGVTWIEIIAQEGADTAAIRRQVQQIVDASAVPAYVRTGEDLMQGTRRAVEQSNALITGMGWVIVVAAGLGVLNTLTISVVERRRELGILRAVGSSRRHIRRLVIGESLGIAVVGGVLGLLLGTYEHWLGTRALGALLGSAVDYEFVPRALALGVTVAVLTTVLGSLGPAWRAASVEVVDAIGYE